MRPRRPAAAAVLFVIGFAPTGCGPSDASLEAAAAARADAWDAQADRELQETLAVLAEAESAMRPRTPAPDLHYDAFRGQAVAADATGFEITEQTAIVETD